MKTVQCALSCSTFELSFPHEPAIETKPNRLQKIKLTYDSELYPGRDRPVYPVGRRADVDSAVEAGHVAQGERRTLPLLLARGEHLELGGKKKEKYFEFSIGK